MRFLLFILFVVFTNCLLSQEQQMPRIIQIENKYGLVDETGKSVLYLKYDTIYSSIPNYENEANALTRLSPVFIFKKDGKYGYTYHVSLDTLLNFKILPKNERYWKTSNLIYDSIREVGYSLDYYTDTTTGFGRRPYYVFKFKLADKWGMFYIRGVNTYLNRSPATPISLPGHLGQLEIVKPIYDKIDGFICRSVYNVKLNSKWTLLQVLYKPKGYGMNYIYDDNDRFNEKKIIPLTWVNKTFYDNFDTIPIIMNIQDDENNYFSVKKDNKWGVIKIDHINEEWEYVAPCIYEHPLEYFGPIVAYTDSSTVLYDYDGNGKNIELKTVKDKDYLSYHHHFKFKSFYVAYFDSNFKYPSCTNTGTGKITYENAFTIFVIDTTSNQIVKSYVSSKDTMYTFYPSNLYNDREEKITGVLIGKKVKSENNFIEYFADLESDKVKFSLDLTDDGRGNCHRYAYPTRCCLDMAIINYRINKSGRKKHIGYYDFKTKEFKKGRYKKVCR